MDDILLNYMDQTTLNKASSISDFMRIIMSLSSDSFHDSFSEIVENYYPKDDESKIHFIFEILFAVRFRPFSIELLAKMICKMFNNNENDQNKMQNNILSVLFRTDFQNSAHMCFLYHLYKNGFMKIDLIIQNLEALISKIGRVVENPLMVYSWFAKEIENSNQSLYKSIQKIEKKLKRRNGLSEPLDIFFTSLPSLRKNDWELYSKYREDGYNHNFIYQLIKNDDIDKFQNLVSNEGLDINQMIPDSVFERALFLKDGARLVHIAAFYGSIKIFKYLVLNDVDLEMLDMALQTIVHFAVAGNSPEIIRYLQSNDWDFHGASHIAALLHRYELLDWLDISVFNDDNPYNDIEEEKNVIIDSAQSNNIESILKCLENKCDINYIHPSSEKKYTPILRAMMSRSLDSVELLSECKGIDLSCTDSEKNNLFHIAAIRNFYEGMEILFKSNKIDPKLINARNIYGSTPLIIATELGYSKIIDLLLDHNADTSLSVKDGNPLHIALKADNIPLLKQLLSTKKFDVNSKNASSFTPLHIAAIRNQPEAIKILCALEKVDVNSVDQTGKTALGMSIDSCDIESVRAFVESHRHFEIQCNDGHTLYEASELTGNEEIINLIKNINK